MIQGAASHKIKVCAAPHEKQSKRRNLKRSSFGALRIQQGQWHRISIPNARIGFSSRAFGSSYRGALFAYFAVQG
jgi:hypothetical protein